MAPTFLQVVLGLAAVFFASPVVRAESHTITFDNKCGRGTPTLIVGGKIVSTGQPYTSNGPIVSSIAYLQTGECEFNGEQCTLLEMTLGNPTCPGCGSSTDISLIAPHAYNVEAGFSYYNGCDGKGATCSSPTCKTAFFQPNDNQVQVQCEEDNVNLLISFCGSSTSSTPAPAPPPASPSVQSSSVAVPTSSAAPSASPIVSIAPPAAPPAVQNAAPEPPTLAAPSQTSSSASAASSSPAVNRGSCRNKRRAEASHETKAEHESRALYDIHHRRHLAHRRGHAAGVEARRRFSS